jgi:hypothetical protein
MSDSLITILTFTYAHEAQIAKTYLESEDMPCYLKDEFTVQTYDLLSNAVGGVKLQVRESDAEAAYRLLDEGGFTPEARQKAKADANDTPASKNEDTEKPQCPYCQSTEVAQPKRSQQAMAIGILLLGFPFIWSSKKSHCFDCGRDFKMGDS